MEYLKCHEENLKEKLLFLQICLCGMSQSTFFDEWSCQQCNVRQVLDLICVPWASSAPNPTARKKRARTTFLFWERAKKKQCSSACRPGYHCGNEIHYSWPNFTCNGSALLVIRADMFVLPSQNCILFCLLSTCSSIFVYLCHKLTEEPISIRWKTVLGKSTVIKSLK